MVITSQPTARRSFIVWMTSSSVSPKPNMMPLLERMPLSAICFITFREVS